MRDQKQLCPELQAVIPVFLADCKAHGLKVGIGECFRTVQEQEELYAKGRIRPGTIVTNCRGTSYTSPHQWGVAFDFFRNVKGQEFDDSDGFFAKVGAIGKAHGLEWGGDWKGWCDKPHLQFKKYFRDGTTKWLKTTYGVPSNFIRTWKVKSDTTCDMTMKRGSSYVVKLTALCKPDVTAGSPGIVQISDEGNSGRDYFYRITTLKAGSVGIYTNNKQKLFVITAK